MKRVAATFLGSFLAVGLVFADPVEKPEDLVKRFYAAGAQGNTTENAKDWHPRAQHSIAVKIGLGQPDIEFSYGLEDLASLPDWQDDPAMADIMKGYIETSRSEPKITSQDDNDGIEITAQIQVEYSWDGMKGTMKQTEIFHLVPQFQGFVIKALDTTYDYR